MTTRIVQRDLAGPVGRAILAHEDFVVEPSLLRQCAVDGGSDELPVIVGDDERGSPHCQAAVLPWRHRPLLRDHAQS